jgi:LPLT family lysophospholipid transporter-like MFS transporter
MNTILQEEGKSLIGAGKTVAIQNFIENGLTVIGLGLFTLLSSTRLNIDECIICIGAVLLLFLLYASSLLGRVRRHSSERAASGGVSAGAGAGASKREPGGA